MRLRGPPFVAFRRRLPACSTRRSTCRPFGLASAVRRQQVRLVRVLLHTAVGRCDSAKILYFAPLRPRLRPKTPATRYRRVRNPKNFSFRTV